MVVWQFLGLVFVAGGIGGLINSLINDKGLILPHAVPKGDGTSLLIPGFIGNIIIGSVAASVSWLLYGPFNQNGLTTNMTLIMASLGGAVLTGMTGSGWLTNAIDKTIFRAVASQAVSTQPDPATAQQLRQASSTDAVRIAQGLLDNSLQAVQNRLALSVLETPVTPPAYTNTSTTANQPPFEL